MAASREGNRSKMVSKVRANAPAGPKLQKGREVERTERRELKSKGQGSQTSGSWKGRLPRGKSAEMCALRSIRPVPRFACRLEANLFTFS